MHPKNFEIAAEIENINPKAKIHGRTGKIKILVIKETKDMLPKLKIIRGAVANCAERVAEKMSASSFSLSFNMNLKNKSINGFT